MLDNLILNDNSIEIIYKMISDYHAKYLNKFGVKLPNLKLNNKFTRDALCLIYLAYNYPNTRKVSKQELTKFIRTYYPDTNDVQQARHLGAQSGWWIVAGGRDNIVLKVERGYYQLYTLELPYPNFKKGHRISSINNFDEIKKFYQNRCVTCGSLEGQPHYHWPGTKTILEKGHKDPNKPLDDNNVIPQCQKCNRGDRNRWVYDDKGRVIKLADANFVKNFDKGVRYKIYKILYNEFNGINPNDN